MLRVPEYELWVVHRAAGLDAQSLGEPEAFHHGDVALHVEDERPLPDPLVQHLHMTAGEEMRDYPVPYVYLG